VGYYASSPEPRFSVETGYAPNQDEFDFCRQFVITVTVRLTEINARRTPVVEVTPARVAVRGPSVRR
jgi:hypothetical protein